MTLDVRTIVVMLILSSVLMAATLTLGIRTGRGSGFAKWNLGLGMYALGWVLVAARGALPDLLTMAAADAVLLAGLCLQLSGIIEFGGARAPRLLLYAPGPVLFLATLPVLASYTAFTVTVSTAYAAALSAIGVQALRLGERGGPTRWMLGATYLLGALIITARAGAMLLDPASHQGLYEASALHAGAFLALFAMTCTGSMAFLLMLRERAEAEIRHLAMFDPLTELFNRRAFMGLAGRELARARRERGPFAVLMMDLDLFKRVNDDYGHQAGDRVLADFAATVRHNVRTEDLVGRYGGEEFCAVLPGADLPKALEIAERIRASVAARPLAGLSRAITVSIGAVSGRADTEAPLDAAIGLADQALYAAKHGGRNRVVGVAWDADEAQRRRASFAASNQSTPASPAPKATASSSGPSGANQKTCATAGT